MCRFGQTSQSGALDAQFLLNTLKRGGYLHAAQAGENGIEVIQQQKAEILIVMQRAVRVRIQQVQPIQQILERLEELEAADVGGLNVFGLHT